MKSANKISCWVADHTVAIDLVILVIAAICSLFTFEQTVLLVICLLIVEVFTLANLISCKMKEMRIAATGPRFINMLDLPYKKLFAEATTSIFISGVGNGLLKDYSSDLRKAANRGVSVRILYAANEQNHKVYSNFRENRTSSDFDYLPIRKTSLDLYKQMLFEVRNVKNMQCREVRGILGTLFLGIDIDQPNGIIKIDSILQGLCASDRPHVLIENSADPAWFSVYREYLKALWGDSKPIDLGV